MLEDEWSSFKQPADVSTSVDLGGVMNNDVVGTMCCSVAAGSMLESPSCQKHCLAARFDLLEQPNRWSTYFLPHLALRSQQAVKPAIQTAKCLSNSAVQESFHEEKNDLSSRMLGTALQLDPALTQALLAQELRVRGSYLHHKVIKAAQGIKIAAQNLEYAVAGTQMYVVGPDDDVEELKEEAMSDMHDIFSSVDRSGALQCPSLASRLSPSLNISRNAVQKQIAVTGGMRLKPKGCCCAQHGRPQSPIAWLIGV